MTNTTQENPLQIPPEPQHLDLLGLQGTVVNARIVSAEIYCSQLRPGELGHTVELGLEYTGGVTQRTGRLPASFVGSIMLAAGIASWSEVMGRVIRVRCSRQDVYSIGHAIDEVWYPIKSANGLPDSSR